MEVGVRLVPLLPDQGAAKAATWLRGSKLSYRQVFTLLHCWQQPQSPGTARIATGLSYTTIARWYWRFRALVPPDEQHALLSGVVEVDEAYFGKKRFGGQTIVMGAIERDTRRLQLVLNEWMARHNSLRLFVSPNNLFTSYLFRIG